MKIHLDPLKTYNLEVLSSSQFDRGQFRKATFNECREMSRIIYHIQSAGSDPNVSDVYLKNSLSPRQFLMLLSSECLEIINFAFFLDVFEQTNFQASLEDKYSLWLLCLAKYPEALNVLRSELRLTAQTDVSNILKTIRVYKRYLRRPKRTQRHKGYRDKGHLPSEQEIFQRQTRLDEAVLEIELRRQRDKELNDLVELFFGMIQ
jgi:hypothetical protein